MLHNTITRGKKRNLLAIIGIAIGVYSVLIITTISSTGQKFINDQLDLMGFDCIVLSANDKTLSTLSDYHLTELEKHPDITAAAPLIADFAQVSTKNLIGRSAVFGIDQTTSRIAQVDIIHGVEIDDEHISANELVCIIDESIAVDFYGRSNVVGKEISLQLGDGVEDFEIIGVASNNTGTLSSIFGDVLPTFVYIPYTTHLQLANSNSIDQIFIEITSGVDFDAVGEMVSSKFSEIEGYENLYKYSNLVSQKQALNEIFSGITIVLLAIASISFLVSGLNIMTIMISAVSERTKEIGVKKAIGATKKDIALEFLFDAFWLSFKGSVIGLTLIYATTIIVELTTTLKPIVPTSAPVVIVVICISIGMTFGVSPAIAAANLDPVQALRSE